LFSTGSAAEEEASSTQAVDLIAVYVARIPIDEPKPRRLFQHHARPSIWLKRVTAAQGAN
jgi:hypothetical protein